MSYSENDSEEIKQFYQTIDQLTSQTLQNDQDYSSLKTSFENLLINIDRMTNSKLQYEQDKATYTPEMHQRVMLSKQQGEAKLQKCLNEFKSFRNNFVEKFDNHITTAEYVLNEIINNYLAHWRENQILVGNGCRPIDPKILNKIQNWSENLGRMLWNTRRQLKLAPMYCKQLDNEDQTIPNLLVQYFSKVENLLQILVKQTVIVEVQPPQVLKTNTRLIKIIHIFFESFNLIFLMY